MSDTLGLGKVPREVFKRSVIPYLPMDKDVELDGATMQLSGNTVIAHSPSIGVPIEALGFFSFHYAASNVASRFGKPSHIVSGIYLPLKTKESDLRIITKTLGDEAKKYGVTVTAGQTATYNGLDIPLLTSTCFGLELRPPTKPRLGDKVVLTGELGGEAHWLRKLSKGETSTVWRDFTPLPVILSLQEVSGVRFMHDVSEGGLSGALMETVESHGLGLNISTEDIIIASDAVDLGDMVLQAPTYGSLITLVDGSGVDEVTQRCSDLGASCSIIGEVSSRKGLWINSEKVIHRDRVELDEIYGSFRATDEG